MNSLWTWWPFTPVSCECSDWEWVTSADSSVNSELKTRRVWLVVLVPVGPVEQGSTWTRRFTVHALPSEHLVLTNVASFIGPSTKVWTLWSYTCQTRCRCFFFVSSLNATLNNLVSLRVYHTRLTAAVIISSDPPKEKQCPKTLKYSLAPSYKKKKTPWRLQHETFMGVHVQVR